MKKLLLLGGVLVAAGVAAADLVPHSFSAGSPIRSAEVNENFRGLQAAAVAQDARLQKLEAASATVPADQLICVAASNEWPINGSSSPCVQASAPGTSRSLTMAQVFAEGWASVAVGGDGNTYRVIMTFKK